MKNLSAGGAPMDAARPASPLLRNPSAYKRTPLRAEVPAPKASEQGVVALRLYDPIDSWGGEWGVSAKEFAATLDGLPEDTTEIRLLINSPGGMVNEGLAILNMLRAHPAKVVAVVEGVAASAASFIAAGVDEMHVWSNAEVFVHNAWNIAIGNQADMRKAADDLAHGDQNLASIYATKAGGEPGDWLALMAGETTFSAEEAVAAGLANKVLTPEKGRADATAQAKARFNLSVFARHDGARAESGRTESQPEADPIADVAIAEIVAAEDAAPDLDAPPELPAAEPEQEITEPKEEDLVSDLSEFRSRLGLDDTADETAMLAAVDALKAQADTPTEPDPTVTAEAEAAKAENADLRKEVELVAAQMKAMSAELAATKAETAAKVKASFLDAAQKQGKFKPADRAQWDADYDDAPAAVTRMLNRIEAGTAVPITATGTVGDPGPDGTDDEFDKIMARLDGPTRTKAV